MSHYRELLRIDITHEYCDDGICGSLVFEPTRQTADLFRNAGLLARDGRGVLRILFDETRLEALQMYAADEASFDFLVYSRDADFRSYTEPFGAHDERILYFDNLAGGNTGEGRMSAKAQVGEADFKAVDAPELEALIGPRERLLPPVFVLRIFPGGRRESFLPGWLQAPPGVYSIRFASRQRFWKYYLLGKLIRQLGPDQRYDIVDPDRRVEFGDMNEEVIANERKAYTFRSAQPIPLHESYPFRLQLIQRGRGAETVVIDSLPVAGIKSIGLDRAAESASTLSEIYINS